MALGYGSGMIWPALAAHIYILCAFRSTQSTTFDHTMIPDDNPWSSVQATAAVLACNTTHAYDLYPRSRSGRMTNQAPTSDTLVLWRQPHPCSLSSLPPFPLDLEHSRSSLRKPQCSPHTPFVVRPFAPLPIIQALLLLDGRAYKLLVFWSQTFLWDDSF